MIDYINKDLYYEDSVDKQLKIEAEDGTVITNEDIYSEEFSLDESICSTDNLDFGTCEASILKIKIANRFTPLYGQKITVSEVLNGDTDNPFQFGIFKVESDKPTADRVYREITAYDALYDIINADAEDVAEWYESLLPESDSTVTMREFRKSFIEHFDLEEEDIELVNDNMMVEKTVTGSSLTGKSVINAICQINGCFGHITREGKFRYVILNAIASEDEEAVVDSAIVGQAILGATPGTEIDSANYRYPCEYEDYEVQGIDKLQIRQEEDDVGYTFGDGDNGYTVEGNFLAYGKGTSDLATIAQNLYSVISGLVYRPTSVTATGNPCFEVGDSFIIDTTYQTVKSYILGRSLKGIQALTDVYSAGGTETREETGNSLESVITQLQGKSNTLTRTVEETRSTITDVAEGLTSEIAQLADSVTIEITQIQGTVDSYEERIGAIEVTVDDIDLRVSDMQTLVEGTVEQISEINVTINQIDAKVSSVESTANSNSERIGEITISLNNIDLRVSDVETTTEQHTEQIASITTELGTITAQVSNLEESAVVDQLYEYYRSTSPTELIGGEWSTDAPDWSEDGFIWIRITISYGSGVTATTDPVCISGKSGLDGIGVDSIVAYYSVSESSTWYQPHGDDGARAIVDEAVVGTAQVDTTGEWTTEMPEISDTEYLWLCFLVTYSDGTEAWTEPCCLTDDSTRQNLYYLKEQYSGITISLDEIREAVTSTNQVITENYQYFENKTAEIIVRLDSINLGLTETKETVGQLTGEAITGEKTEYYLSTSDTELTGGEWTDEVPTRTKGTYIWSRTTITIGVGDAAKTTTSDPICLTGADGVNGTDGIGVDSITAYYSKSGSASWCQPHGDNGHLAIVGSAVVGTAQVDTDGEWSTEIPDIDDTEYLWLSFLITYSTGEEVWTEPCCLTDDSTRGILSQVTERMAGMEITLDSVSLGLSSLTTTVYEYGTEISELSSYIELTLETITGRLTETEETAQQAQEEARAAQLLADGAITKATPYFATSDNPDWYPPHTDDGTLALVGSAVVGTAKVDSYLGQWSTTQPEGGDGIYIWCAYLYEYADGTEEWQEPFWIDDGSLRKKVSEIVMTINSITLSVYNSSDGYANIQLLVDGEDSGSVSINARKLIAMEADDITIKSGSLTFESGTLIINSSGLTLDTDGNATFSGTLNAATGTFTSIYTGNHSSFDSTATGVYAGTSGLSVGSGFSVDSSGNLTATSMTCVNDISLYSTLDTDAKITFVAFNEGEGSMGKIYLDVTIGSLATGTQFEGNTYMGEILVIPDVYVQGGLSGKYGHFSELTVSGSIAGYSSLNISETITAGGNIITNGQRIIIGSSTSTQHQECVVYNGTHRISLYQDYGGNGGLYDDTFDFSFLEHNSESGATSLGNSSYQTTLAGSAVYCTPNFYVGGSTNTESPKRVSVHNNYGEVRLSVNESYMGIYDGSHSSWIIRASVSTGAVTSVGDSGVALNLLGDTITSERTIDTGSDERLKDEITALTSVYDAVFDNLNPLTYRYKSGGGINIGFTYQDVCASLKNAGIDPMNTEIVSTYHSEDGEEYGAVAYDEFIALTVYEVQKTIRRQDDTDNRIAELEAQIAELKSQIAKLQATA